MISPRSLYINAFANALASAIACIGIFVALYPRSADISVRISDDACPKAPLMFVVLVAMQMMMMLTLAIVVCPSCLFASSHTAHIMLVLLLADARGHGRTGDSSRNVHSRHCGGSHAWRMAALVARFSRLDVITNANVRYCHRRRWLVRFAASQIAIFERADS